MKTFSHCSCTNFILNFIFFVHTGIANFGFNLCSIFPDVVLIIEKGSNAQNHSTSDPHYYIKISPSKISHPSPLGRERERERGGDSHFNSIYLYSHKDILLLNHCNQNRKVPASNSTKCSIG